jgi:signal transduction histidine kinase
MSGPLDASRLREARFRRARVLVLVVVAVCLATVGWWVAFQVRASRQEMDYSVRLGEATPEVAQARRERRLRMAIAEGGFLGCALVGGVVTLYWLLRRELQREHEQNQLLAAVSHDFKTPLTAIRLIAQSFELDRVEAVNRGALARRLVLNTKRLEELVDNVLAAARLHAGRLHATLESVDLGEELARCLEQRRDWFMERGVTVDRHIDAGVRVRADRHLLQSVVGNLLDNAVKYSRESPHVDVTVARAGASARLVVADRGAGFESKLAPKLFERFQRGDAESDQSRPGLGLGLYLVRELVRLHDGRVSAHSDGPGKGARFEIELALAEGAAVPNAAQLRGAAP